MKLGSLGTLLLSAALLVLGTLAQAESAPDAFASGKALLAGADFRGALEAFGKAARADRSNQEYLQHYAMVRQVLTLRAHLDTEKDDLRWEYIARGLHTFYLSQGLYDEALTLDKSMHARLNTALSAALLAETQLALNRNAEAVEVLAALDPPKQTAATRALHGLALARDGKRDEARRIAGTIEVSPGVGPGVIYTVARLSAAVGNADQALVLLRQCFESVAPSRLDVFKGHARKSPEFAGLAATPAFAQVLQTKSKVPESQCSGGTSCAGCPMRGKCPHSQGK